MFNSGKVSLKLLIYIIILLILILSGLNYHKFSHQQKKAVTVWTQNDRRYFKSNSEKKNFFDTVKKWTNPKKIIYELTEIRVDAPITYLKREIPLLAHYTPEGLKEPGQTIYQTKNKDQKNNNLIQLQFDLSNQNQTKQSRSVPDNRYHNNSGQRQLQDRPVVAIYHSHTSETYIDDPRSGEDGHVPPGEIGNIAKVGQHLANVLSSKYDIKVYHTTKVHDREYNRSYTESRKTVKRIVSKFPEADMILDLHRDAVKIDGRSAYTTTFNNKNIAKIMIVVTTGEFYSNLNINKPEWDCSQNLTFAQTMASRMEQMYPRLLKDVEKRETIYNQDLHPKALLLEMGDYQNTTREVMRSSELLADVIAALVFAGN